MHADFWRRENIWQFEMMLAIVVLIEMIVFKHVIFPIHRIWKVEDTIPENYLTISYHPYQPGSSSKPNFLSGQD